MLEIGTTETEEGGNSVSKEPERETGMEIELVPFNSAFESEKEIEL